MSVLPPHSKVPDFATYDELLALSREVEELKAKNAKLEVKESELEKNAATKDQVTEIDNKLAKDNRMIRNIEAEVETRHNSSSSIFGGCIIQ